jgi:hypothetical protein
MALNTTTAHQWVSVVSQNDFRGDHRFFGRSTLPVKRHKGDMGSNRDSEAKEIAAEKGITVTYCPVCGDFLFNGQHRGNVEGWCRELREKKGQTNDCD